MLTCYEGDTVTLRDGRIVYVTDAADQVPEAYPDNLPVETIFVGMTAGGRSVVSDMSEIVSILNQ